ncbi:ABC transporter substrate-binding protein [Salipaludibacillus daqingensis]|uniref:ABC transporter substrate-binding protein n=1 Tax=Salipaludibacillus daqingensis TaxID=3041001 RepID=UPI0024754B0E|nr:ABC transporter substrate-binding protein [Salipaludibacillus daqingensis]
MINKVSFTLVWLLLVFVLLSGCQTKKESGQLSVYAGMYPDHAIKAMEQFQRETGIQVNFIRMSNGDILDHLQNESEDPVASVWYGGPADIFAQAKKEGLLYPYVSPNASFIPDKYKNENGYWTGIYVGVLSIVANRQWHVDRGLELPQTWKDLLREEYRNWISLPDPRSSGTGYLSLSLFTQLYGEKEGFEFLHELDKNVSEYTYSGNANGRSVAMGDSAISIMFAQDAIKLYKEGFRDINVIFPKDQTAYEVGAVAIIENAPDLEEAKIFVDWALTKQAQEIGKQVGNYQLLTHELANSPDEAIDPSSIPILEYDISQSGSSRKRLINRWEIEIFMNRMALKFPDMERVDEDEANS